jgi:Transposase IS4
MFKLYYDDEVQTLIIDESVKYARQKNNTSFVLDRSDLDVFIGIMLLTGYHSLPKERMYWCRDEDVQIPYVSSKMSRNRFTEFKKFVHVADNDEINAADKNYKVRPLMDMVNSKLQVQLGIFSRRKWSHTLAITLAKCSLEGSLSGLASSYGYWLQILDTPSTL